MASFPDHDLEAVIEKTVETTLTRLGFDVEHPIEAQADVAFLRAMRVRCEKWRITAPMTFLAAALSGLIALGFWLAGHLKWQ